MSQHRPLTSAATPRHGTPRAARRLALFLLVFLTLAAGAPFAAAEMVYYTEDFWHEGEPGFDPIFSHEFEWPAGREESTCWYLWPPYEPADTWALALMYGTRDTITFNLAEGERIVYASAGTAPYAFSPAISSIKFIGDNGTWETSGESSGETLFEISSAQIGYIRQIELYGTQSGFTTVTIGVVPEPSAFLLLCSGLVAMISPFVFRNRRRT